MHNVTKILVVFATIMSVFLSALVISYSVNADRIQADYTNALAAKASAEASAATQAVALTTHVAEIAKLREQARSEDTEKANKIRALESQIATMMGSLRALQDSSDKNSALAVQLASTNETQTSLISGLRKDADDSRTSQVTTAKQNAELEKAIADLRRTYEAAENEKKLVREQLAEAKAQIDALRQGGGTLGSGKANEPFNYTGPTISGKVEELTTETGTGATLAKISVGTNHNVRENMKMAIRRDNEFVANVVIVKADLQWAIGRIDLLGRPVTVQVGDVVQSDLR